MQIEFLLEELKRLTKSNVGAVLCLPYTPIDRIGQPQGLPLQATSLRRCLIGQPRGLPLQERIKWHTIREFIAAGRCV